MVRLITNKFLVLFFVIALCGFTSLLAPLPGSGLLSGESVSPFLNGNFPVDAPFGTVGLEQAYPNLTFNSGLTWTMHPAADTVFVGQRDGLVSWFVEDETTTNKTTFLDLRPEVGVVWDGGFLGMAMHPDFGKPNAPGRNYFYVYFSTRDGNGGHEPTSPMPQPCISGAVWNGGYNILRRYAVIDGTLTVDQNSGIEMFKTRHYNSTHYGGGLAFGDDGFLYLSTGDQAQHNPAQDISTNLDAAVLRMDVNKDPAKSHAPVYTHPQDPRGPDEVSGVGYWIPNDNPWVGQNVFEEYWSMGHRNPHRMTKDRATGELWIAEIGSSLHEEVNLVAKGENFGWPVYEGYALKERCLTSLYNGMAHNGPLVAFPRSEANAIIGGFVYRGTALPQLYGKYICADYGSGNEIWAVDIQTGQYDVLLNYNQGGSIITFGEDHDGELIVMALGNSRNVYRLAPTNAGLNLPSTLSQTGAFSDLSTLTPAQGVIPYELIESFWSDGAVKKRWMVVPNNGTHNAANEQVKYSENGVWEYPVGSVLIKHFELPIDHTDPSITRRLETRFVVVYEPGEAYWLTYRWRNDGTDADLLTTGLDEPIAISTANGPENQVWHYPSRAECFSCHNENSMGTLGLRTRNLNSDYTYPSTGLTGNQLVSLSAIGILDQTITDGDTPDLLTHARIDDIQSSLEDRARSYLDLNCAYCHQPATGNRAVFDARLSTPLSNQNYFSDLLNESLNIPNEAIVVPFDTAASVLYQRIHTTGFFRMPPIAKNVIDQEGSNLIADWIMNIDTLDAPCPTEHFDIVNVFPYAGGQDQGTATVLDQGETIRVADNGWKALPINYQVTANTVLSFNFRSGIMGEEHSIGMANSLSIVSDRFKLYGTQNSGNADFNTYSGSGQYEQFTIPIGQYISGQMNYLFFVSDKDASPQTSESLFNEVRIFEDTDGDGQCDGSATVTLAPKLFLQGPYMSGQMGDQLRAQGAVPEIEPYSAAYQLIHAGGEKVSTGILGDSNAAKAVDWVLIELRDVNDSAQIVASRPAMLFQDGSVYSSTGGPVELAAAPGAYFVSVRHRNHLGVMTAAPLTLGETTTSLDFTSLSTNLYGSEPTAVEGGVRLLWSGDANADGKLRYTGSDNDRDRILLELGGSIPTNILSGYHDQDVNMDGVLKYTGALNDRDAILLNIGGAVVTNIREEQLP